MKGRWIHKTGLKLNLGCACCQIDPSYFTSLGASTFQAAQAPLMAGSPATEKTPPPHFIVQRSPAFSAPNSPRTPLCVRHSMSSEQYTIQVTSAFLPSHVIQMHVRFLKQLGRIALAPPRKTGILALAWIFFNDDILSILWSWICPHPALFSHLA